MCPFLPVLFLPESSEPKSCGGNDLDGKLPLCLNQILFCRFPNEDQFYEQLVPAEHFLLKLKRLIDFEIPRRLLLLGIEVEVGEILDWNNKTIFPK